MTRKYPYFVWPPCMVPKSEQHGLTKYTHHAARGCPVKVLPSPRTPRVLKPHRALVAFIFSNLPRAPVQAVMKGYSAERPRGQALFTVQVGFLIGRKASLLCIWPRYFSQRNLAGGIEPVAFCARGVARGTTWTFSRR